MTWRARLLLGAVVLAVTWLATVLTGAGPLYARDYPSADADSVNAALTGANLETGFAPRTPRQFQPATFTATIVYARKVDPHKPVVQIAASNVAALSGAPTDFRVQATSASRVNLDEGSRRPGGGYQLSWTWRVTPLRAGDLSLTLRIEPTVYVKGHYLRGLRDINEPLTVTVAVSPVQRAFDEVVTAAHDLQVEGVQQLEANRSRKVSASMSLAGQQGKVRAGLQLDEADGSVPLTITELVAADAAGSGTVHATWLVTPQAKGVVKMKVTAVVDADAGTDTLHTTVVRPLSVTAQPSLVKRVWVFLGAGVVVLSGAIGLMTKVGDAVPVLRRIRKALRARAAAEDPQTPGTR